MRRLLLLSILTALAHGQVSLQSHYIGLSSHDSSVAIAADASGNLFIVSRIGNGVNPSIRVNRTDPSGNVTATLNFGQGMSPSAAIVDAQGNLLVLGNIIGSSGYSFGAYIARLDNGLTTVLATGTVGPFAYTQANAIAADAFGNIYIAGDTSWGGFPTAPGAYQRQPVPVYYDEAPTLNLAFMTELTSDLSMIVASTFYGGSGPNCDLPGPRQEECLTNGAFTRVTGLAFDPTGSIVAVGATTSNLAGSGHGASNNEYGFIARFSSDLTTLKASLLYDPAGGSSVSTVTIDADGNVLVTGVSGDGLPFPAAAIQQHGDGGFIATYDPALGNLLWGTYLGDHSVNGIGFDSGADIWVTGLSTESALPGLSSASNLEMPYIAEFSSDGSALLNLTPSQFGGAGIATSQSGQVAFLGYPDSFVTTGPASQPLLLMVATSASNKSTGTIAPVELLSLYGPGIGPASPIGGQVVNGAFTSRLGGYQVLFNSIPSPLLYAGPNQMNVVSPAAIAGQSTVQIQVEGPQSSITFPTVWVSAIRPQMFSAPAVYGTVTDSNAIALNPDGTLNIPSNPAPAGSIVTLWATGTGLLNVAQPDGRIVPQSADPIMQVPIAAENSALQILYGGQAPIAVLGLTQINVRLPPTAGTVAVQFQQAGEQSDTVLIYTH